jgi:hypothetical protein
MNKEQIIDKVYKRYVMLPKELSDVISDNEKFNGRNYTQEEFINKIKTDTEFSEKWGLKIEERELSLDEELEYMMGKVFSEEALTHQVKIPTKLITVTYKETIIESYE